MDQSKFWESLPNPSQNSYHNTHTPLLNDNQKSEHHPAHKIQSEFRALPSKPDLEFGAPPHHPPPEMPRKHHRHTGYQWMLPKRTHYTYINVKWCCFFKDWTISLKDMQGNEWKCNIYIVNYLWTIRNEENIRIGNKRVQNIRIRNKWVQIIRNKE